MALFSTIGLLLLLLLSLLLLLLLLIISYLSLNYFSLLISLSLFCLISYIRQFWLIDYFFLLPFPSRYLSPCKVFLFVLSCFSGGFSLVYLNVNLLLCKLSCFYGCFFLVYLNVNLLFCKLCFIMIEKKVLVLFVLNIVDQDHSFIFYRWYIVK